MRRRAILAAIIILLLAIGAIVWLFRDRLAPIAAPDELTLGAPVTGSSLLIFVAHEKGYFRSQGLNVKLKDYQSGVPAVAAVTKDEVDIAAGAEFVFVRNIMNRENLKILATIAATNDNELVVRKDRGIEGPPDLKGKKIGLVLGSSLEFFLGTFLAFNDLPITAVHTVNLQPAEWAEALSKGTVDGVVTFGPHTFQVKAKLGANAVNWPIQHEQDYYFVMVSNDRFTKTRPETVKKLLRALLKAEEFAKDSPREAQAILQKKLGVGPEVVSALWHQTRFEVRLPQNLLLLMEDEMRWLRRGQTGGIVMPDYFSLIYRQGLNEVKPEAVGIIQ